MDRTLHFFVVCLLACVTLFPAQVQAQSKAEVDPRFEALAREIASSIQSKDTDRFNALLPTFEEFQLWVDTRFAPEKRASFGREWFDRNHSALQDEFREGLDYLRNEHPCVDPAVLSFDACHVDPEPKHLEYGEAGSQSLSIYLRANYPGQAPLRFRLTWEVMALDQRIVPVVNTLYLFEHQSPPTSELAETLVKSILHEDLPAYYRLMAEPADVLWYADNRMPKKSVENFRTDWKNNWEDPSYFDHDLSPYFNSIAKKRFVFPDGIASVKLKDIELYEVELDDRFVTHEFSATWEVMQADGSEVEMKFWMDAAQGRSGLKLMAFDMAIQGPSVSEALEEWTVEDCWAATEVEQDFRRQYKEGNYEMAVLSGSYLWFCLESMDPERAAEVCLMFGSALYHRMEATRSDADLIFSADAFYAAFEIYGAEAISKATWARLYEPYREEVRKLLSAAGARGEELLKTAKEDDTAKAAKVYGAIVTAGLLAEGQDDLIRHATVGSGSILVLHYYRDQNYRKGYEYGELALPLTDEIMGMDAAEIVKRLGRTQEVLSFSYLAFCACGQQLLSPKYNDFAKNGFLSSTVRPLYDTTEKALRMAERLGLKESEVTIARNFLNQIRDALVSKGK